MSRVGDDGGSSGGSVNPGMISGVVVSLVVIVVVMLIVLVIVLRSETQDASLWHCYNSPSVASTVHLKTKYVCSGI